MPDITDILALQIKKEVADRYFGFRKLIEEDKLNLEQKIKQYSYILEKRISFDLIRIYVLLNDEALIQQFLEISGIEQRLFYDKALVQTEVIRKRVFEGVRIHGFTKRWRFENFLFKCYDMLVSHVEQYRLKIAELKEFEETIVEEINLFYKQNDLCAIMGFLRSLGDHRATAGLEGGMEPGMAESLENKLRIEAPLPIESFLPVIPSLPILSQVKNRLSALAKKAFDQHDQEFLRHFSHTHTEPYSSRSSD